MNYAVYNSTDYHKQQTPLPSQQSSGDDTWLYTLIAVVISIIFAKFAFLYWFCTYKYEKPATIPGQSSAITDRKSNSTSTSTKAEQLIVAVPVQLLRNTQTDGIFYSGAIVAERISEFQLVDGIACDQTGIEPQEESIEMGRPL